MVTTPNTARKATRNRVTAMSPVSASPTAATRASSVSSTEWYARWNGKNRSRDRSRRSRPDRGAATSARSSSRGSPL